MENRIVGSNAPLDRADSSPDAVDTRVPEAPLIVWQAHPVQSGADSGLVSC